MNFSAFQDENVIPEHCQDGHDLPSVVSKESYTFLSSTLYEGDNLDIENVLPFVSF